MNVGNSKELLKLVAGDPHEFVVALCHPARYLAAHGGNLAFKLPKSRFVRVLENDPLQCRPAQIRVLDCYPVGFHLLGYDVTPRDFDLFLFGIAGQADHLHPVSQRRMNCVEHVCGCHKHDV